MKNHRSRFSVCRFAASLLIAACALSNLDPARGEAKPADAPRPVYFRHDGGVSGGNRLNLATTLTDAERLAWRRNFPPGHSTPCVVGDRVFLTTFREDDESLATVAVNLETGRTIWRREAPADRIEPYHRVGSPAAPSPASDGHRVYVLFGSFGLLCYDLDGNEQWRRPLGPFQDEFGTGSSPVLAGNKVVISQDHDVDSFVAAYDAASGDLVWKTARPDAVRSYSTPIIWNPGGDRATEVIVAGALRLTGYDLETGRETWWTHGLARIVNPTPVASGDVLFVASWSPGGDAGERISLESWSSAASQWDADNDGKISREELGEGPVLTRFFRMDLDQNGGLDQGEWERHAAVFDRARNTVFAIEPPARGEAGESDKLWEYDRGVPYVASPLVVDGTVYLVKDGGIVTSLDAASGRRIRQARIEGLGSYYASPVSNGNHVLFASEQGVVTAIGAVADWTVQATRDFGERIYATPILLDDGLLIRTETALYRFEAAEPRAEAGNRAVEPGLPEGIGFAAEFPADRWTKNRVNVVWFDNVVIAREYIGPSARPTTSSDGGATP